MKHRRGKLPIFPIEGIDGSKEHQVAMKERIAAGGEVPAAAYLRDFGNRALPLYISIFIHEESPSVAGHGHQMLAVCRVGEAIADRRSPEAIHRRDFGGMDQLAAPAMEHIHIVPIAEGGFLFFIFIIIRRSKGEAAGGVGDVAAIHPHVHISFPGITPALAAIGSEGNDAGEIAPLPFAIQRVAVKDHVGVPRFVGRNMDRRGLCLDVRLVAQYRRAVELPQNISIFHIHGVETAVRTFLADVDHLFILRNGDAADLPAAHGMAPQLLAFSIKVDQLPIHRAHQPALVGLHIPHLAAVKAHAVILPPGHVPQGNRMRRAGLIGSKHLPRRPAPGQVKKREPSEGEEEKYKNRFTLSHRCTQLRNLNHEVVGGLGIRDRG